MFKLDDNNVWKDGGTMCLNNKNKSRYKKIYNLLLILKKNYYPWVSVHTHLTKLPNMSKIGLLSIKYICEIFF